MDVPPPSSTQPSSGSARAGAAEPRYDAVAIVLHWAIGLAILFMLGLGLTMTLAPLPLMTKFTYFQLHKSLGITILLLVLLRIVWRLGHRPPPLPPMPKLEARAAHGTHWLLYALMLFMPLTGWAVVSASKHTIPTVLFGVVPWPHLPVLSTLEDKGPAEAATKVLHLYGAWLLIAVALLHIAAALRHQFVRHDTTLWRMLPLFPRPGLRVRPGRVVALAPAVLAPLLLAATPARAADWAMDPARSSIVFTSSQAGEAFKGHFKRFTGTISFDPAKPEDGHATIQVDTASAETGDAQRDAFLPQPDWFDAAKSGPATFEAQHFVAKGTDMYDAVGTLTLRGVKLPVTLPFKLTLTGDTAHAVGNVTLNRQAFGVGQGQFTTPDWVPFDVGVTVDITARRAAGS